MKLKRILATCLYKTRWFLNYVFNELVGLILSWSNVCHIVGLISLWQLLVKSNILPGLIPIQNKELIDLIDDLSIGFLAGYFLWLLSVYVPTSKSYKFQLKRMRDEIEEVYNNVWDIINNNSKNGKISWRPLGWLSYRFPNFDKTLEVILLKSSSLDVKQTLIKNNFINRIRSIESTYAVLMNKRQLQLFQEIKGSLKSLNNSNDYKSINHNLSEFIISLYKLKERNV